MAHHQSHRHPGDHGEDTQTMDAQSVTMHIDDDSANSVSVAAPSAPSAVMMTSIATHIPNGNTNTTSSSSYTNNNNNSSPAQLKPSSQQLQQQHPPSTYKVSHDEKNALEQLTVEAVPRPSRDLPAPESSRMKPMMGMGMGGASMPSTDNEWERTFRHPSTNKYIGVSIYKTPKNVLIQVIRSGMAKAAMPWWHVFIMAFMAGAYISMGGALAISLGGGFLDATAPYSKVLQRLIGSMAFPFCLMMIVVSGGELFTGQIMYMFSAVATKKIKYPVMLMNWLVVWLGNFAGCAAFAFLFICTTTTGLDKPEPWHTYLYTMMEKKTHDGWGSEVLKGVACNWLVCMSLWWAACAEDVVGKVVGIWWAIFGFVAIGFEHSIANMFYLSLGLMDGAPQNFGNVLAWNLIPVTIGNIIGGLFFIGVQLIVFGPYFAPQTLGVKAGEKKPNMAMMANLNAAVSADVGLKSRDIARPESAMTVLPVVAEGVPINKRN